MPDDLVIAVMSDLHAHDKSGADVPSSFSISGPADQPAIHPIAGLKKLIKDSNLRADMVLCPGDIADKANPAALAFAWKEMLEIRDLLKAERLIATAGNHDMDSRYQNETFDAKGMLLSLVPTFPGLDESLCDRYWARNFVVVDGDSWRLLILNSSAYHGAGRDQGKEFQHGRVSTRTVEAMKRDLRLRAPKEVNVLLCHHHLVRDTVLAAGDYSEMQGGDELLETLGSGEFGLWLVIHGHKHRPNLMYAPGGVAAPVIFCAGSLCAHLYHELVGHARNQFYLLRIPTSQFASLGVDLIGQVTAWDWIHLRGWQPAGLDSGLPHRAGFGYRAPFAATATTVANAVKAAGSYLTWSQLTTQLPHLDYILPRDLQMLIQVLKSTHGIEVTRTGWGEIQDVGLRP
jgi:predicted phosphodiesterase